VFTVMCAYAVHSVVFDRNVQYLQATRIGYKNNGNSSRKRLRSRPRDARDDEADQL